MQLGPRCGRPRCEPLLQGQLLRPVSLQLCSPLSCSCSFIASCVLRPTYVPGQGIASTRIAGCSSPTHDIDIPRFKIVYGPIYLSRPIYIERVPLSDKADCASPGQISPVNQTQFARRTGAEFHGTSGYHKVRQWTPRVRAVRKAQASRVSYPNSHLQSLTMSHELSCTLTQRNALYRCI